MWVDLPNWQPVSSFVEPVAPVDTDVDAAPLVCLQLNASWLPYIVGALMQLIQPTTWDTSDPTVLANMQQQALTLMELVGTAEGCSMLTFQFDSACNLQFSNDGGTTWTDVPGWPTYAPGCYTGPAGPTGPTGPTGPEGGFTPGTPPQQPGQSTAQFGCSVSGYIANQVIKSALSQVVSGYNAGDAIIDIATAIITALIGGPVAAVVMTNAVNALYGLVLSGTIAHYEAAESDATLWSTVTCAIYGATYGTGYVTSANYAAVEAAIAGISYTYPDVIAALAEFVTELGVSGLEALQIPGALEVADCSGCSVTTSVAYNLKSSLSNGFHLPSHINIDTGPWTIGMWIKPITNTGTSCLVTMVGPSGNNELVLLYLSGLAPSTDLRPNGGGDQSFGVANLTAGNTYLLIWTNTGVPGTSGLKIYNSPGGSIARGGTDCSSSGGDTYIGAGAYPAPGNVLVADITIWLGHALTSAEMDAWYALPVHSTPPASPSHFWPCDEGTGGTIHDAIGGDDATTSGTPAWGTLP